jgi:hypothetical protein
MSVKNKKVQSASDKISDAAKQGGILLMAAAATLGMFEVPDNPDRKTVIVPNQPAFATASQPTGDQGTTLRREREEAGPHYISYSVTQRTPGRTGKF